MESEFRFSTFHFGRNLICAEALWRGCRVDLFFLQSTPVEIARGLWIWTRLRLHGPGTRTSALRQQACLWACREPSVGSQQGKTRRDNVIDVSSGSQGFDGERDRCHLHFAMAMSEQVRHGVLVCLIPSSRKLRYAKG